MSDSFRQLILCPEHADFILPVATLKSVLDETGLIGGPVDTPVQVETRAQRFYVGQYFLQHISFMGCAPAIEFQPPGGVVGSEQEPETASWDSFTFIYLPDIFQQAIWLADLQMAKAVCPACNRRIAQPEPDTDVTFAKLTCPHCQHQAEVCDFNWREFGGCARMLLSIVNVYPKEAIPSGNLLKQLHELTHVEWRYFYINAPLPREPMNQRN